MGTKANIESAGQNLHTVILTAMEADGSIDTREAEPYSYRVVNGKDLFFCYDIKKGGLRSFRVPRILKVKETNNSFKPRWEVEF